MPAPASSKPVDSFRALAMTAPVPAPRTRLALHPHNIHVSFERYYGVLKNAVRSDKNMWIGKVLFILNFLLFINFRGFCQNIRYVGSVEIVRDADQHSTMVCNRIFI